MRITNVGNFRDSVVLHFQTEGHRINAYTLASTLVSIADAAKAANTILNAGHEIEIVVEAVGPGSFRAQITAIYESTKNIFSSQIVAGVIIGVLANYIYERTLAVGDNVKVEIHTDEVVIERGDDRVVVPRNVYEATRQVENNTQFKQSITKTLKSIEQDKAVDGLGFVDQIDTPSPGVIISRDDIMKASLELEMDEPERYVEELVDLQIIKAILEKSRRKWEFMWRGVKISAPITHDEFYAHFFAHDITIAPGDILKVRLQIKQVKDTNTGIYSNQSYEVIEVYEHIPRLRQMSLDDSSG